jgi:hypothetical protein
MARKWSTLNLVPCGIRCIVHQKNRSLRFAISSNLYKTNNRYVHSGNESGNNWPGQLDPTISKILDDQEKLTAQNSDNLFDMWCSDIVSMRKAFAMHPFPEGNICHKQNQNKPRRKPKTRTPLSYTERRSYTFLHRTHLVQRPM